MQVPVTFPTRRGFFFNKNSFPSFDLLQAPSQLVVGAPFLPSRLCWTNRLGETFEETLWETLESTSTVAIFLRTISAVTWKILAINDACDKSYRGPFTFISNGFVV